MPAGPAPATVADYVKPFKNEAIMRLRHSIFGLVVALLLTYLLPLPSPHERRLGSLVVDVCPEILQFGLRRRFRLFDSLVDFGFCLLLDSLKKGLA